MWHAQMHDWLVATGERVLAMSELQLDPSLLLLVGIAIELEAELGCDVAICSPQLGELNYLLLLLLLTGETQ